MPGVALLQIFVRVCHSFPRGIQTGKHRAVSFRLFLNWCTILLELSWNWELEVSLQLMPWWRRFMRSSGQTDVAVMTLHTSIVRTVVRSFSTGPTALENKWISVQLSRNIFRKAVSRQNRFFCQLWHISRDRLLISCIAVLLLDIVLFEMHKQQILFFFRLQTGHFRLKYHYVSIISDLIIYVLVTEQ